jgi:hypothetical protein
LSQIQGVRLFNKKADRALEKSSDGESAKPETAAMVGLRNTCAHKNLRNSLSLPDLLVLLKNKKGSLKSARSLDRLTLPANGSTSRSFKVEIEEIVPRRPGLNRLK